MKRSDFIKSSALSAIAISTSGFIRFNGIQFTGDCETTSDVLGPYYRPNSPVRNNLRIKGEGGEPVQLSGYIRHSDCATPYKHAKVELWHCDTKGVYDNESAAFRYRGTTYSDANGFYVFDTTFPVAYGDENFKRPAHFHLMISAEGYRPLITQLYFKGDEYIKGDAFASSPNATKRILEVQKTKTGTTKVRYDVGMSEVVQLEAKSIDKLVGKYTLTTDANRVIELFNFENRLWIKNEAFGNKFEYTGNNTFELGKDPFGWKLEFKLLPDNIVELTESFSGRDASGSANVYRKKE